MNVIVFIFAVTLSVQHLQKRQSIAIVNSCELGWSPKSAGASPRHRRPCLTTTSILHPCVSADIWWSQYSLLPYWDILWFESAPSCKKFGKHCHCAVQVRYSVGRKRFPFGMDCYSELWTTTHYHTRWETAVSQQPWKSENTAAKHTRQTN